MDRTSSIGTSSIVHGPGTSCGVATASDCLSLFLLALLLAGGGGMVPQFTVPRRKARTDDGSGNVSPRLSALTVSPSDLISAGPLTNFTCSFFDGEASTKKSPVPFPVALNFWVR